MFSFNYHTPILMNYTLRIWRNPSIHILIYIHSTIIILVKYEFILKNHWCSMNQFHIKLDLIFMIKLNKYEKILIWYHEGNFSPYWSFWLLWSILIVQDCIWRNMGNLFNLNIKMRPILKTNSLSLLTSTNCDGSSINTNLQRSDEYLIMI